MTFKDYIERSKLKKSTDTPVTEKQLLERCLKRGKKVRECMEEMTEAMAPEKAANSARKLRRGLATCDKKYRGEPDKAKACKERLNKIIAKLQARANK